ncbi:DUF4406 domain-containing protein [Clostridium sp. WB02_MRS01]|uniref:DUF7768 domain-containing protein n=1 Tax=Clostridium sp. WB02_MRS01 TaxID=2605777 RepID=UPI0012B3A4A7|nr:DUF4406 domain-containing protein [Clostridium sp. WB02_MRS01]MSS11828.1 DUF4406 domain-containing protein [Clostridium sp. WB02_MRS01]
MGIDKFNSEGYYDPTTYTALTNIHRDEMAADKKAAYRPLVYICSPYAGDTVRNVKNARKYSRFAFEQSTIPIAAHLLFPQFMDDRNLAEREAAMHFNYVLLGKCEELWVFGDTISNGMAHEIGIAKKRRQKIRYFSEECKEAAQ